jgi:hypothetical protein
VGVYFSSFLTLELDRSGWVVTIIPQSLYRWRKGLWYLLSRKLGGPQNQSEHFGEERKSLFPVSIWNILYNFFPKISQCTSWTNNTWLYFVAHSKRLRKCWSQHSDLFTVNCSEHCAVMKIIATFMWYEIYFAIIIARYIYYSAMWWPCTSVGRRWICSVNTYCSLSHCMILLHNAFHSIDRCSL